jgi:hypothetical protein
MVLVQSGTTIIQYKVRKLFLYRKSATSNIYTENQVTLT